MENHHFQWVNPLFLWPFSIAKKISFSIISHQTGSQIFSNQWFGFGIVKFVELTHVFQQPQRRDRFDFVEVRHPVVGTSHVKSFQIHVSGVLKMSLHNM